MKKLIFITILLLPIFFFGQKHNKIKFELLSFSDKKYGDFAPTFYKDGIIFTSNRKGKGKVSLFYSDLKGKIIELESIDGSLIGPAFYDVKTEILYTTRHIKQHRYSNHLPPIELYMCIIDNWKVIPAKKLTFKSTLKDFGHADILNNKMVLTTSSKILRHKLILYKFESYNWIEDEIIFSSKYYYLFPRFINENTIVFSSNLKGGKGGLDLYKIIKKDGKWSNPINLEEFNTKHDDFSLLYINENEGYISSNRIDNIDHIFKFTIEKDSIH